MIERKYPKVKVSVIQCPVPNCGGDIVDKSAVNDVEPTTELVDKFANHLIEKHGILLSQQKMFELHNRISYIRSNGKIHYIDPFLYVAWDWVSLQRKKRLSEL